MAVQLDSVGVLPVANNVGTSITSNKHTVGTGNNRALVVQLALLDLGLSPTNISVIWDSGGAAQNCSLIKSFNNGQWTICLYGLIAPISGNKTLSISWTNTCEGSVQTVSFTGVNQTGGTTSFPHSDSNTSLGTTSISLTINSNSNRMGVAVVATGRNAAIANTGPIQTFTYSGRGAIEDGGSYSNGGSTMTFTGANFGSSDDWIIIATDIAEDGAIIWPISDVFTGTWTTTPLWSKINADNSDADLISSPINPTEQYCEVLLSGYSNPNNYSGHSVNFRCQKSGSSLNNFSLTVGLYQNTTLIVQQTLSGITNGWTTTGFSLTTGQASQISDYTNLRLRFSANNT